MAPASVSESTVSGLGAQLPDGKFAYGATLSYACENGLRFEDGQTTKQISCVGVNRWTESGFTCAGMQTFNATYWEYLGEYF